MVSPEKGTQIATPFSRVPIKARLAVGTALPEQNFESRQTPEQQFRERWNRIFTSCALEMLNSVPLADRFGKIEANTATALCFRYASKVSVKRAAGEDRRREFSVSWAWTMLSFATMRSSVRSNHFSMTYGHGFWDYVPQHSNSVHCFLLFDPFFQHGHRAQHFSLLCFRDALRVDFPIGTDWRVLELSLHGFGNHFIETN